MDPSPVLIGLDIGLVALLLYVLDRNIFHYVDLSLQAFWASINLRIYQRLFGVRLWLDRQALIHRGPVGRLWNEYSLWRIRNNPAYKEFFQDMPKMPDK
jgi:hypothetical protein